MRGLVSVFAVLFAAVLGAGCSGGGDGETRSDPVTIVVHDDVTTEPSHGTFTVTHGSHGLGCSDGTLADHPLAGADEAGTGGAMLQVFTCTDGERSGSFIIRWEQNSGVGYPPQTRWKFDSGTGDYHDIRGKGLFSLGVILGPKTTQVQTVKGKVHFP